MYLYFEILNVFQDNHQHEIEPPLSSFLLYWAFLAKEHLFGIFKGIFFTIKKDTTKPLGLRGIRVLETTSRGEETNANGGTKWRQISKTLKKSLKKIPFDRNQIFFSGNVIALCVDLDEKIKKNRYGHFKSKKRARKITPRVVSRVNISFAAN